MHLITRASVDWMKPPPRESQYCGGSLENGPQIRTDKEKEPQILADEHRLE